MANKTPASAKQSYPTFYWISAFLPFLFVIGGIGEPLAHSTGLAWVLFIIGLVASAGIFTHQMRLLYPTQLYNKLAKRELALVAGVSLMLPVAALLGDQIGTAHFADTKGPTMGVEIFLFLVVSVVTQVTTVFALTNTIYFATDARNKALNTLGRIAYWIFWIIAAIASYLAYNLLYTLHDPSTE